MKKAKFVLGAVAALGIVAAVFAFKARTSDVVFTPNPQNPTFCNVPLQTATLIDRNLGTISTSTLATFPAGPCTLTTIYVGL